MNIVLVRRSLLAVVLWLAGCTTTPCPQGTMQQGQVCKVVSGVAVSSDAGADAKSSTGSTSPSGTNSRSGDMGNGASSTSTASTGSGAGSGSQSATSASSAGTSANMPVVSSIAGTAAPATAGRDATHAVTAGASALSAAGRAAGSLGSAAGSSATGPTAGNVGHAGAAAGAGASVGTAGQSASTTGDWTCLSVGNSCTCVQGVGSDDLCDKPKPTCCVTFETAGLLSCECWPEGSSECMNYKTQVSNAQRVSTCPPGAK
jgi:hypothetical protein